jgi:hypothetical protein
LPNALQNRWFAIRSGSASSRVDGRVVAAEFQGGGFEVLGGGRGDSQRAV